MLYELRTDVERNNFTKRGTLRTLHNVRMSKQSLLFTYFKLNIEHITAMLYYARSVTSGA